MSEKLNIPKFCTVLNMHYSGEISHATFEGTHYVFDDGDSYLPNDLNNFEFITFMDNDPREKSE